MANRFYFVLLAAPLLLATAPKVESTIEGQLRSPAGEDKAELERTLKVMEAVVKGTIPYEIRGKTSKASEFSVDSCRVPAPEILKVFVTGSTYTQKYEFDEDCDIEGTVVFSRNPFQVNLKTRHTGKVDRVKGLVDYTIKPDLRAGALHLQPFFKEGQILVGDKVLAEFTANYKVTSDLLGNIINNEGGVVNITQFQGKPVSHSHKFKTEFVTKDSK